MHAMDREVTSIAAKGEDVKRPQKQRFHPYPGPAYRPFTIQIETRYWFL